MVFVIGIGENHIAKEPNDMKWIEVVQLRAAGNNQNLVDTRLKQLVKGSNRENRQPSIMVCRHAVIPMDYSIHIIHNDKAMERTGSPLGLQLVAVLKEFGLVNHSIWHPVFNLDRLL